MTAKSVPRGFTVAELIIVVMVLVVIVGLLLPVLEREREKARRVNCAGNLKCIGSALLMYASAPCGYFPVQHAPGGTNFEPLIRTVRPDLNLRYDYHLIDGKSFACPSAAHSSPIESNSSYRYRGSGLKDDNDSATIVSVAYDQSGNHPDNQWMNAVFIDGHIEGAKPDGKKGWNRND